MQTWGAVLCFIQLYGYFLKQAKVRSTPEFETSQENITVKFNMHNIYVHNSLYQISISEITKRKSK